MRTVHPCRILSLAICCLISQGAEASTFELYIQDLGGDNEQARAIARQMLPREGAKAVPKLIELLKSENQIVWRAAYNVLEDIANGVGVPGKEAERHQVADNLMALAAPGQPDAIRERALRLLPRVIPDNYDVTPIAGLLKDPGLREKARACLIETGTSPAAQALAGQLTDSDPSFTCALLDGLAAIRDPGTVESIQPFLSHSDPGVRAAALRALAWTGNPDFLKPGEKIFEEADPKTHWQAGDGLLRLADALLRKGGNHSLGISIYQKVLHQTEDKNLQGAALAGLGRYGDESVVPALLEVLSNPGRKDLSGPVWTALGSLQGPAVSSLLIKAYPGLDRENQLVALATFGGKADPAYLPILEKALSQEEADFHRLAAEGLASSQLAAAVPLLVKDIASRKDDSKRDTLVALHRLADDLRLRNEPLAVGEAYFALYQAADTDELRNEALEGVKSFPTPAALEMLLEKADSLDLNNSIQLHSCIDIARGLMAAGRADEAGRILDRLIPRIQTPEMILQAIQALAGFIPAKDCAQRFGFITTWKMVGGFPWTSSEGFTKTRIGEPKIDLNETYSIGGNPVGWSPYTSPNATGLIDFASAIGQKDRVCGFAFSKISIESPGEAKIKVGSDDGIRVWVNEQPVLERNVDRGSGIDQDQAPIQLQAGENRILIQVTQGGGGWNAFVRLTKVDGSPLKFSPLD
ncbi:MAG: HEAT repeat domain-containing protein [Candidatus Omnitrophica bacterium]|nr:HEAT repeat domain-containing protein [Candidatus Omnitrophota bacterium]